MKNVKKAIFSIIAVFLLLVAMSGRYFEVQPKHHGDKNGLHATHKNSKDKAQKIATDFYTVIVPVAQVVFHSDFIFEFELPSVSNQKAHSIIFTTPHFTEYYRTLFRIIISPNAP